jgi:hypothetical protein
MGMSSDGEKHPIRNGIIIAVISGLLLTLLLYIFPLILKFIWSQITAFWKFLGSPVTLYGFAFIVLVILSMLWLVGFIGNVVSWLKPKGLSFEDYREDVVFDVRWKWKYPLRGFWRGEIQGFCVTCGTRLVVKKDYFDEGATLYCETCYKDALPLEGDLDYTLGKVARQIERRIENGEWKSVVEKNSVKGKN